MRVLTADDHALVRSGIRILLEALPGHFEVDEASSFDEAAELMTRGGGYDLVLLDWRLLGFEKSQALEAWCEAFPDVKIVVVSDSENRGDILGTIAAGARGYIPKSLSVRDISAAIQLVLRGFIYVPDALGKREAWLDPRADLAPDAMTKRQRAVFVELLKGRSSKDIGQVLGIAEGTVKIHLAAIYRALGVRSRAEAIAKYRPNLNARAL